MSTRLQSRHRVPVCFGAFLPAVTSAERFSLPGTIRRRSRRGGGGTPADLPGYMGEAVADEIAIERRDDFEPYDIVDAEDVP